MLGDACGVMMIISRNEFGILSSNPDRGYLLDAE